LVIIDSIAIVVGISVVTNAITVIVSRLARIHREWIGDVSDSIAIVIRIGIVSQSISIRIDTLTRVEWE
jgi:hypothetical protein